MKSDVTRFLFLALLPLEVLAAERTSQLQSELTRAHREYYEATKSNARSGDSKALYDKIVAPVEKKMHDAMEQENRSVTQKNQSSEPKVQSSSTEGVTPSRKSSVSTLPRSGGDRDYGPRGREGIGVDPGSVPAEVIFPGSPSKKPSPAR